MGDRNNPIKFGPEWLRNLARERSAGRANPSQNATRPGVLTNSRSSRPQGPGGPGSMSTGSPGAGSSNVAIGSSLSSGSSGASLPTGHGASAIGAPPIAGTSGTNSRHSHSNQYQKIQLAKLRYGREEMLALYDRTAEAPEELKYFDLLYQLRGKPPVALNTYEEETREARAGAGSDRYGVGRGRGTPVEVRGRSRMPFVRHASSVSAGRGSTSLHSGIPRMPGYSGGLDDEGPTTRPWSGGNNGGPPNRTGGDQGDWTPSKMFRRRQTNNTNWRQTSRDEGDEWRQDNSRANPNRNADKWDRDWSERPSQERPQSWNPNRRHWAGDSQNNDDNLPEWAIDSAEAGAGTFDSSGAFHGYSNDDTNIPKSQEPAYPLTRSNTHGGSFVRSKTVEEGSEEWWASEKAKKLSPKRFEAGDSRYKKSLSTGSDEASGGASSSARRTGNLDKSLNDQESSESVDPPESEPDASNSATDDAKQSDLRQKFSESITFDALMRSDIDYTDSNDDRGNFQSVMITPNNSLRQKHQNIVTASNDPAINRQHINASGLLQMLHGIPMSAQNTENESAKSNEDKIVEDLMDMTLEESQIRANMGHHTSVSNSGMMNQNQLLRIASPAMPPQHGIALNTGQGIQNVGIQNQALNSSLGLNMAPGNNGMGLPMQGLLPPVLNTMNPAIGSAMQARVMGAYQQNAGMPVMPSPNIANSSLFMGQNNPQQLQNNDMQISTHTAQSNMFPMHGLHHASSGFSSIYSNIMPPTNLGGNMSTNMGSNMPTNLGGNMSTNMGQNMPTNLGGNMSTNMGQNMPPNLGGNMSTNMGQNMPPNHGGNMSTNMGQNMPPNLGGNMSTNMGQNMPPNLGGNMVGSIGGTIGGSIGGSMGGNIGNSIGGGIGGSIGGNIGNSIGGGIGGTISGGIIGNIGGTIGGGIGGNNISGSIGAKIGGSISGSLGDQWFYEDPKKVVQGPFTAKEMYSWYRAGFFSPSLMVRRACESHMRPLGSYGPVVPFAQMDSLPYPITGFESHPQTLEMINQQPALTMEGAFKTNVTNIHLATEPFMPLQVPPHYPHHFMDQPNILNTNRHEPPRFGIPPPRLHRPMDSLWGQPGSNPDHMWMQQGMPRDRVNNLPMFFWDQPSSAISSNSLLPEEIAKEMKTEDQILAQLRASQNMQTSGAFRNETPSSSSTALSEDAYSTNMNATPDLKQLQKLMISDKLSAPREVKAPSMEREIKHDKPNKRDTAPTTDMSSKSHVSAKAHTEAKATKQARSESEKTKTKETTTKTKKQKAKEDKKDEDSKTKDDDKEKRSHVISPTKGRKDDKINKKELEKEKKEWIKEGFTIVKGAEKGNKENKKKLEEAKAAEEVERKKKEDEKVAAEEEIRKRKFEIRKHQELHLRNMTETRRAPWSAPQIIQHPDGLPLDEIQRLEREKKVEQIREQQNMVMIFAQEQAAVAAREQVIHELQLHNAPWNKKNADRLNNASGQSFAEIQAETRRQSSASHSQAIVIEEAVAGPSHAPWSSSHNGDMMNTGGFWDTQPSTSKSDKAQDTSRPETSKKKKVTIAVVPKKENTPYAEFDAWSATALSSWSSKIDVPTFVGFLKDIESPYEVKDYVKCYLGESKESSDFARQFLERRSKLLRVGMVTPSDDLCSPAMAINPRAALDYQEGKGKKTKKNKMLKVDARILGFSVTASEDRINVGDIDTV